MDITGKIHLIKGTERSSDKFQKRDFVVAYSDNPAYPQYVQFQMTQDRCAELDKFNVGDTVDVTFNLRGREWVNPQGEIKYFNTLEAWRVSKSETAPQNGVEAIAAKSDGIFNNLVEDDTLPF